MVKTAIHGNDPNWGSVAMAIGKCYDESDIIPENITILFSQFEMNPRKLSGHDLYAVQQLLKSDEVLIHISLGTGHSEATVWGCDLSSEYPRRFIETICKYHSM